MHISELQLESKDLGLPIVDTRLIKLRSLKETMIKFQDFVVDGQAISKKVMRAYSASPLVSTPLQNDFVLKYRLEYLERLLGEKEADLPSGRVALYVCPFDGDLICDAIGCRIEFTKDKVIWKDFAWDGIPAEDSDFPLVEDDDDFTPVEGLTEYAFDLEAYRKLLNEERDQLTMVSK